MASRVARTFIWLAFSGPYLAAAAAAAAASAGEPPPWQPAAAGLLPQLGAWALLLKALTTPCMSVQLALEALLLPLPLGQAVRLQAGLALLAAARQLPAATALLAAPAVRGQLVSLLAVADATAASMAGGALQLLGGSPASLPPQPLGGWLSSGRWALPTCAVFVHALVAFVVPISVLAAHQNGAAMPSVLKQLIRQANQQAAAAGEGLAAADGGRGGGHSHGGSARTRPPAQRLARRVPHHRATCLASCRRAWRVACWGLEAGGYLVWKAAQAALLLPLLWLACCGIAVLAVGSPAALGPA
jgi:hypothetical protein